VADRILAAVAIQRELIEGEPHQTRLHNLIKKFAGAQLYKQPKATTQKIRRAIWSEIAKRDLPYAQATGKASAKPILDALGGKRLTDKGMRLRGRVLREFNVYHKRNIMAFRAELVKELGTLSSEVEAAFAKGFRDGIARQQLIRDLLEADKAELKQIGVVRKRIKEATKRLEKATKRASKASKRQMARAKRALREAKKRVTKARAQLRATKSFYARFETKIQGHARDAIRRECQRAQEAVFRQAGYTKVAEYTWIAVNGTDACPSCKARHGRTMSLNDWEGEGKPGDGHTLCGDACMCQLVPAAYTEQASGIEQPLVA